MNVTDNKIVVYQMFLTGDFGVDFFEISFGNVIEETNKLTVPVFIKNGRIMRCNVNDPPSCSWKS